MIKKLIIAGTVFLSNYAYADTVLGIDAGVQQWYYDYSGDITDDFGNLDLEDDLGIGNETSTSAYISIEHPVPFVPNFKLKHSQFSNSGFSSENQISSRINLDHTDLSLYYEVLDNWLNLDLGLSLIYFDGGTLLNQDLQNYKVNYSEIIPALYGKAQFEFPITDLSASVTINTIGYSDTSYLDSEIAAQYKLGLGFDIEAGIRRKSIDIENLNLDSTANGVFAGINFHF